MDAMDMDSVSQREEMTGTSEAPRRSPVARPTNALSKLMDNDTDSENDKAPVQLSRGKLLAGLQPQADEDSSESEEEDVQGAYERIRQQLMSGPSETGLQKKPDHTPKITEPISSEDEEDMPVLTSNARRSILRQNRNSSPRVSPSPSVPSRDSSPGLFVTPNASPVKRSVTRSSPLASDDENLVQTQHNTDLEERVKRIRAERQAMQKERQSKKSSRPAHEDSGSNSDGESGRRLTQHARPTRRAGKKAMEDIAREQQRISRNMQLTHQSKTKKRYSIKDLFANFGVEQKDSELVPVAALPTPDASSIPASSDAEAPQQHDTQPRSPEDAMDLEDPFSLEGVPQEELATADSALEATSDVFPKLDKGKGRAADSLHIPVNPLFEQSRLAAQVSIAAQKKSPSTDMVELSDSDDDLEIVKSKSRFPVFDNLPQQKQQGASSLLVLRHLAQTSSSRNRLINGKKTMSMNELQFTLAQKARQQAIAEREEKIEDMRRRGIHVETAEELEKHQLEVEDLVAQFEKAQQEDLKLGKLERKEAKKNGETGDGLASSDESEDDDYVGSGEDEVENPEEAEDNAELDLSGSEEEEMGEADDEEEIDEEEHLHEPNALVDDAAEETDEEPEGPVQKAQSDQEDDEDEADQAPIRRRTVYRSRNIVMDDDEDDEQSVQETQSNSSPSQSAAVPSQTQEDDGMAAFGFNNVSSSLGLTQMFAGTMANMGSVSQNAHPLDFAPEQDSLDFLRSLPYTQPGFTQDEASQLLVPNSQNPGSQQVLAPIRLGISQLVESTQDFAATQFSEAFEPTQNAGFELPRLPAELDALSSTVDTVVMQVAESPVAKKKGKLHQRRQMSTTELSGVDEDFAISESESEVVEQAPVSGNAFSVLEKAAKKQKRIADAFDKKNSKARDVIEEQAAESEDEYAGIGGASDDESEGDDEELAKMIDTSDVKVDEGKLAAYWAEKTKKEDEKSMNQLYKDLMNGGLRKRRGADAFDVSDPEDEIEQRQRRKRQDYQQKTRALLADERIGVIAANPKKAAFFQTLTDHMDDPEYEFLNAPEMDVDKDASQSQSQDTKEGEEITEVTVPDSRIAGPSNGLKRKSMDSQEKENHAPPPSLRRTGLADSISRKPMTLADVQHSVSELLEDSRIMVPDSQYESDSDLEIEYGQPAPPREIIDRLQLSRNVSASEATANGTLAFMAPTDAAPHIGFRVPALVRRATSNLSSVSTSTSGTKAPAEGSGIRRGGTGRSNIHAQAREAERRAALEKVEKKRKDSVQKKVGKARLKRSALSCLENDGGFS